MTTLATRTGMMRLSLLCFLAGALSMNLDAQCSDPAVPPTVTIELTSAPYAHVPTVIRLLDYYSSGATIGTATATRSGFQISVLQTNSIAPTLPTTACREQFLDLGLLPAGTYDVTWTTTETTTIPFPTTNTRVRTLTFSIRPAGVPATSWLLLVVLAVTVAGIGTWRVAR